MEVSFNWLKRHVNLPASISAQEVAEKLKLSVVEVENCRAAGEALAGIVVGKVISAEKHPQADKLKLCQVDIGKEKVQVVCGGSNVRQGMLVALAKVGAKVRWHGEGEPVELKPTTIRNVESFGMICSSGEIGLGEMFPAKEEREIVDLTDLKLKVGLPLAKALNLDDAILEIDNKSLSHRPDLWGHYGLARELSAIFRRPMDSYKTREIKKARGDFDLKVKIEATELCQRYMAVAVSGVKIAESPDWLKKSLLSVGLRPINNVVDITNYVMLDLGQPMHAFDAARLNSKQIIVRKAEAGEMLETLDNEKIKLSPDDLVIADSEKPLALAGIIGGQNSGVDNHTTEIIFESANFAPATIRRTSSRLGLRTESSIRFEKGLDPVLCQTAMQRAVEFLLEMSSGAKVVALTEAGNFRPGKLTVKMPADFLARKLGVEIPAKEAKEILSGLGFEIKIKKDEWVIQTPSWRARDVVSAEDVAEEVLRIYGYDKIPSALPSFQIVPPGMERSRQLEHRLREILARGLGFSEVYNYSFVSREQASKLGDRGDYLELDNPLSKEKPLLRRSLLPNLLENVAQNIEFFDEVKIFEIGKVYLAEEAGPRAAVNGNELLPRQDVWLTAIFAAKKDAQPFSEARRAAENIFAELGWPLLATQPAKARPWEHPTRVAEIALAEKPIGRIFELNPALADNFGLSVRLGVLEINLSELSELKNPPSAYSAVSSFPEAVRDLAFVIDKQTTHAEIIAAIEESDPLLKSIELFDVFEGKGVPENKKSVAYRFIFGHDKRTLAAEEIESAMKKISDILRNKLGVEIRT